jgi:phosphoesterase RecJ-like protein
MQKELHQCQNLIESHLRFCITTHINPDGDALGSETALAHFLSSRGKEVVIINQSETPQNYKFLNSVFPINIFDPAIHTTPIQNADCIIVVDANAPGRFDSMKSSVMKSSAVKICVDHHPEREPFADIYCIDEEASATGEILYDLFLMIDPGGITTPVADGLYTAIMTDTGSFRFPKTNASTHAIITDLIQRGADPASLYQKIFEDGPVNKLRLLGNALASLTVMEGGKVAYMTLAKKTFRETGTVESDTDTMINHALTVGGVRIALLFVEIANGVKVSFRSKGTIPINELAKEFGGNGHVNAAGARIYNRELEMVVNDVTQRAAHYAARY